MLTEGMFSSNTCEWETPQDIFDKLSEEFGGFDLDVCATPENAKCPRFYTKEQDGLSQEWSGKCWMNPPYGREISKWVEKAAQSKADLVVCLLPARTDTKWFHNWCIPKGEVRFLPGRLKFGCSKNSAPFPSMIVIFNNKKEEATS